MPYIVIVEDEHAIAQLYKLKFELEEFDVAVASNGSDGLRLIKHRRPDLVLLDLKMPYMSGDEMLAKLRASEWGADIRVAILTNLSRDEAPSSLRFLGVERYIVKANHTPAQVIAIVHDILGIRR